MNKLFRLHMVVQACGLSTGEKEAKRRKLRLGWVWEKCLLCKYEDQIWTFTTDR